MAYVEEFNYKWYDGSSVLHEVKLLLESGVGPSADIPYAEGSVPVELRRLGNKDVQLNKQILGSELIFKFVIDPADIADYEPIFESNFKDWKLEFYINSSLYWTGFVKPENYSRQWIAEGIFEIKLSATDGLATLKNIEYVNATTGAQYSDRVSLITTIKRALEHLGLELDFRVQLNTYESALMTSTQCALDKITQDNGRFTKLKDGREVNDNCYSIIEKTLRDFNCYLVQHEGKYWIVNPQEKNSFYYPIPWSTLTIGTRTASDLRVDITNYKYFSFGETQKIRPIEECQIIFKDRNVQDNLLSNGDFSSGTTGWNKTGYFGSLTAGSGYGSIPAVYALDTPPTYVYTDNESITQFNTNDEIEISFKARITSFTGASGTEPLMKVEVYQGSNYVPVKTNNVFPLYESSSFTTFTVRFSLPSTAADYQLRIYTYARSTGAFTSFNFEFDDVYWVPVYADGGDLTFDRFYSIKNTDSVYTDIFEEDLFFGDSQQDNDIGSFQISGTRSTQWNRFGKTENTSIQVLYAQNIIENFSRFKEYIRTTIYDPNRNIGIINLPQFDSLEYQIIKHTEIYRAKQWKEIKCELVEVINSTVNTSVSNQQLTSVDGESQGSTSSTSTTYVNGAEINDSATATNTTWSSTKINSEISTSISGLSSVYLKLDASNDPMQGALDHNGYDILNTGNIEIDAPGDGIYFTGGSFGTPHIRIDPSDEKRVNHYFNFADVLTARFLNANASGDVILEVYRNATAYNRIRYYGIDVYNTTIAYYSNRTTDGDLALRTYNGTANQNRIQLYGASDLTVFRDHDGNEQGRISGSDLLMQGEVTAYYSSDRLLKTNIKNADIESEINRLLKIDIKSFYHIKHLRNEVGAIAQNINKDYEDFVKHDSDGYLMIDYQRFIPILILTVQEILKVINIWRKLRSICRKIVRVFY